MWYVVVKEESLAATRVQALWRGYRARHYDVRVVNLRHEIRARRSEDHIRVLQCELDRWDLIGCVSECSSE